MEIPDNIDGKSTSLDIVVLSNGNSEKAYQTILRNLTLHHNNGTIEMQLIDQNSRLVLKRGPVPYALHPIGSPNDHEGGFQALHNWEFSVEVLNPDLQYFVVFTARETGTTQITRQSTNFILDQPPDPLPTHANPFND